MDWWSVLPLALFFGAALGFGLYALTQWRFDTGKAKPCALIALATLLVAFGFAAYAGPGPALLGFLIALYAVGKGRFYLLTHRREKDENGDARGISTSASRLPLEAATRIITGEGDGTGFVVSSDGHIVTVAHGVAVFGQVDAILYNGERYPARIVAVEPSVDLAVLKVDVPYPLPAVLLDDPSHLAHGDPLFVVGYDPMSDVVDAQIWTPQRYRRVKMPYPTVLRTSVANAGYDDRNGNLPPLDALLSDPNRALRPGFSGAMVCDKSGEVVAIHNSGFAYGNYGGEIGGESLTNLLAKAGVKTKRSFLWRMPLWEQTPESARGAASIGLAEFFSRYGDDSDFTTDDTAEWREYFAHYSPAIDPLPEYAAFLAFAAIQEGRHEEAEVSAFAALEGGITRFVRRVLTRLAEDDPSRALPYAERLATLRSATGGEPGYGLASRRRAALAITEAELRERGGDLAGAEALLVESMPDLDPTRRAGVAWFRIGKLRLAQDRPEEAVEAFRKGVGDDDLYREDWSPLIEACSRSSRVEDHQYGVKFALWALDHSGTVATMPPYAAACAQRRGEPELAAWFESLGRALSPVETSEAAVPE